VAPDEARRVYPFSYFLPPRDRSRRPRIQMQRDMAACLEVVPALLEHGFRYGEPLLNFPPPPQPKGAPPPPPLHVDTSFLGAGDLILTMTRPPLDDSGGTLEDGKGSRAGHDQGREGSCGGPTPGSRPNRKLVGRGLTDLEELLFESWKPRLHLCTRLKLLLPREVYKDLEPGFELQREMHFKEGPWAPFKQPNGPRGRGRKSSAEKPHTALFLLRVEQAWPGGPGMLGAFGMDGMSTLLWAYRLGRDLRHLLLEPGFVVADLEIGTLPARPTDLRWAMDWPIQVVLRHAV